MEFVGRLIAGLLFLSVAAGCTAGGGGAEPVNGMGEGETQAAGQAITQAGHTDARNYRNAGDAGMSFGGCTSSFPATPADADGDNIPDELTVITYTSCTEGGVTFSGNQTLQDSDTSTAGFAFTSAWSIDATGTFAGGTIAYSYDAALTASGGTAGTFSLADASDFVLTVTSDEFDGTIEDGHAWDIGFTPDDGVWSPAPGLPLEAGDLLLSGAWDTTVESEDGDFELTGVVSTSSPLRTDPGCITSIVSGTVEVIVAEPEEGFLTVTWTGCGATDAAFSNVPGL